MTAFDDPKELLGWADENVDELKLIISNITQHSNVTRVTDVDPKTGNKVHKLAVGEQIPARARRLIAETIIHTRHALDQTMCAVWTQTGLGEPPNNLYFPLPRNTDDLKGRLKADPLNKLPAAVLSEIRAIRPYPSVEGGEMGNDFLVALSDAAKSKHRLVPKINGTILSCDIQGGLFLDMFEAFEMPRWDMEKGEVYLGTTGPDGDIQINIRLAYDVVLEGTGKLAVAPVSAAMTWATELVRKIVENIERVSPITFWPRPGGGTSR